LVAKGEIKNAAAESGVPWFFFMHLHALHGETFFLILQILSIPVKPFGCGYAALSSSW